MRASLQQLKGKKNLVGAEIGVDAGYNASRMLSHLDIKKLYLVDPYLPYVYNDWNVANPSKQLQVALNALKSFKDQIVWINTSSLEATKYIEDNSLDFVYIDGNHQYEFVKADIKAWLPKVKKGGILGGHDYTHPETPAVKTVVDEIFLNKGGYNFFVDLSPGQYDWWIVKGS